MVKLITFNVCGIKNLFGFKPWNEYKTFGTAFDELGADIVCLQETKLQQQDLTKQVAIVEGYQSFFTFSTLKKGYSGVAVYIKKNIPVLAAEEGLSGYLPTLSRTSTYREENQIGGYPDVPDELGRGIDIEGRALVLDIGACVLIGLYCPANSQGDKQEYRDTFFLMLDERVRRLKESGRRVVVLGDINVTPYVKDSAEAQQQFRKAGVPSSEWDATYLEGSVARGVVRSWLDGGDYYDTTRRHHPETERLYTCWDLRKDGRGANFGSRIDLIIADSSLECTAAGIMTEIFGSDHCPVYADLMLQLATIEPGYKAPLLSRKRCAGFASLQSFWKVDKKPLATTASPVTKKPALAPVASKVQKASGLSSWVKEKPKKKPKVQELPFVEPSVDQRAPSVAPSQDQAVAAQLGTVGTAPASLAAWKDIFTQKKPVCGHGDVAKLQKCKSGPNKGRSFWCCERPQGEDGDPKFRCKFFQWS